ncbi:MAG: hypothetical protein NZM65_05300 [Flavobacteriales bacterium]|nr:hypothetical protein [Flavobacteriales bacterium]MDW8410088.1 hypothetical protein [Flavobacteriales bacterium]
MAYFYALNGAMLRKVLLIFTGVGSVLSACKKKNQAPDPNDQSYYYPVNIGRMYEYQIDTAWWDHANDTSFMATFLEKETYDTDFPNQAGQLETRIIVERGLGAFLSPFGIQSVQRYYNASKKYWTVQRVRNTFRYIMLKYPIAEGDTFNRNALNPLGPDTWRVDYIGGSFSVGGKTYSPCLRLVKKDVEDSLRIQRIVEVYAHNVGLVYAEITDILGRTDTANWPNIPVMNRIESGYSFVKTLVRHDENIYK